jgi:hypothetical protein
VVVVRARSSAGRSSRIWGLTKKQIDASCTYFEEHGGWCDCEILFNVV